MPSGVLTLASFRLSLSRITKKLKATLAKIWNVGHYGQWDEP